jgi:predicted ester cyclase
MQLADIAIVSRVQEYLAAWNAHDGPRVMRAFVEGGTYSDPTVGTVSGQAIGGYVDGFCAAFPDLHFDLEGASRAGDDVIVVRWLMRGTHLGPMAGRGPTGRAVALPGVDIMTVEGDKLRSVVGYFDQKTFFEQLGLQVLLAPQSNERVKYGVAAYTQSGRRTRPGAFSTTWIEVRDEREQQRVIEGTHRVVAEAAPDPGFISWIGMVVDGRMFTATAWQDIESMQRVMRGPAHRAGMELALVHGVGTAMHTSAWVVDHQNSLFVRCPACGALSRGDDVDARCRCGQALPEPPAFW